MKILIKNGKVWDGNRFYKADVLTLDDKIWLMDSSIDEFADYVYDAKGKIVSCGLVDCHVHMSGISCDEYGINADLSCIPFGVTAAADAGGNFGDSAKLASFLVKSRVFAGVGINGNRAIFDHTEKMIGAYSDKIAGLKLCYDACFTDVRDLTPLEQTIDFAEKNNLIVMVHCSGSPVKSSEILKILRKGDILTHAYHGGANNAEEDGFESLKDAQMRGVIIDVGMAGHVHTDFKIFKNAIHSGAAPDTISTDITCCSAYKRGGKYGMTMCMSVARTFGMSEDDIFRAVTSSPAKVIGKAEEWGYLQCGRCADIAVLEYSDEGFWLTDKAGNTVSSKEGYRCVLTICNGQVVYRY